MKKYYFLLSLLCFIIVSCGENSKTDSKNNFKDMSGLTFGMTQSHAKRVLRRDNHSVVSYNDVLSCDSVTYLNFDWSYLQADFSEDMLFQVKYCISNVDTISSNTFAKIKTSLLEYYTNLDIKKDKQNKFVLGNNDLRIELLLDSNLILAYRSRGTLREISRIVKERQELEDEINDKLKELTEVMIDYAKCLDYDPYHLREHYATQAVPLINYLNSHYDDMTPKQKEYFKKLNEIEI